MGIPICRRLGLSEAAAAELMEFVPATVENKSAITKAAATSVFLSTDSPNYYYVKLPLIFYIFAFAEFRFSTPCRLMFLVIGKVLESQSEQGFSA